VRTCKKPRSCRHRAPTAEPRLDLAVPSVYRGRLFARCALPLLSETKRGARGALRRLRKPRADSLGVHGPRATHQKAHDAQPVRAAPCLRLTSPTRRRARFMSGGAGPCSWRRPQRTIPEAHLRRGGVMRGAQAGHAARGVSGTLRKRYRTPSSSTENTSRCVGRNDAQHCAPYPSSGNRQLALSAALHPSTPLSSPGSRAAPERELERLARLRESNFFPR